MESPRVELESTSLSLDGSLFTGGGAVGALMRSVDWSRTPLGPVSSWPQSLRTAVSICIASRFPILVWWGPQLVKLYNDTYAAILGAKHPRALGAPGREVWPEIWHIIGPMLEGVLQRGESTWSADLMLPLERKGFSEECYFTFSYSPIRDESGGIGGVFSAIAETTERVLSERRLATLGELSARTSAVRGTAADACRTAIAVLAGDSADVPFAAVYLADGDEEARLVASFGVTPGSAAAPNVARSAPRDDELPSPWPVAEVLRQGSTIQIGNLGERVRGLPGEGGPHAPHTALTIPLRRGDRDRPYGVLVAGTSPHLELEERYRGFFDLVAGQIATAISSVRAYEEERRRAEALAELDRAKTIFFSNVSHEFRTPLTLMLGPLEDALDDAAEPLPPGQRSRLTLVQRNGLRLLKLVNSLLDFSRIEAGRVQARYEPVDLAAITADLASSFRAATDRAGLKLIVDCESLGEPVYVDEGMWEKIVLNLLSNAFKFTFNGSIRVSMHRVGNEAELQVSDTGIGIAADALPRIFERFHRVEGARARTHEGSGIGLSLVQELVRLHTGKITVASEPNRGTTFTVRIPLGSAHLPTERVVEGRRQASTRLGAAPFVEEALRWLPGAPTDELPSPALVDEEQATPAATTSAQRARVLIVDDNADMRAYLARLLAPRYEVTAAADGLEALESIRLTPPDLVVSDVMMPRLDGVELLRALREGESTRTMPVILLSARAGEEATLEGLDAGADDYLVKPFSARELLTRVRTHLELSAVRSRAAADREQLISKLETERGRLLELFEQAPAFLAVLKGPSHIFTLTNPAYEELIGFRAALGKPVREALPEIADQGFFATLDRVYATGRPFAASEARVLLRRGDELEERFLDFVYQPMRDADGDVDGILVQGVDVTARVHASRQIEELLQSVQEASEAKSKFLSMMSHELRTPLNAITGFADLLALGVRGPITTEQAEDVRRIRSASQYLLSIINDLLNFSRLEAGRVEFRVQEVSVMTAVTEAQSLIASQLRDKSLAFDVTDCEQLTVRADPERLQQILLNLLTNAIKFTPAGGRLGVRCRREDGVVCIAVSDTGRGIPADQLEHIFDPFVQVDRQQKQAGVGLGLAISRDLARGMSGELSVESTPGVGSTFTLRLPATA